MESAIAAVENAVILPGNTVLMDAAMGSVIQNHSRLVIVLMEANV